MKSTDNLENVLASTHTKDFTRYLSENNESLKDGKDGFYDYIKTIIKEKNMTLQNVFLMADIPERYGYKLLSGEKHTRQRDVILRICYAAGLSLAETQKTLKLYEMPQLYARIPRDALLMIVFNERPGSVIEVNTILKEHNMNALRTSGAQD